MKSKPRTEHMLKKIFVWLSILLIATLLLYAAYNKLATYEAFVQQLRNSQVTAGYENFLAWFVPCIEILISVLILIPKTRVAGLYGAFFLMLSFTIYVYVVPHFFKQQTCSCGGIIETFSWKQHFYFNLFFTLLAGASLSLASVLNEKRLKHT